MVEAGVQTPPIYCSLHGESSDSCNSSLPSSSCSSPISNRFMSFCNGNLLPTAAAKEIFVTSEIVALDICRISLQCAPSRAPCPAAATMRRLVAKVLIKHNFLYRSMIRELSISALTDNQTDAYDTIVSVAGQLFGDGKVHWGRIVALYAFLAKLIEEVYVNNGKEMALHFGETCAKVVASYLTERLGGWIIRSGGWAGFIKKFPEDDYDIERRVFKSLLFTGLGLGLLAGFFAVFK